MDQVIQVDDAGLSSVESQGNPVVACLGGFGDLRHGRFLSGSNQRVDCAELLGVPHVCEFGLMLFGPLLHQAANACWQAASQNIEVANGDHRSKVVVSDMEVRRVVLVKVHRDHDPERAAWDRIGASG